MSRMLAIMLLAASAFSFAQDSHPSSSGGEQRSSDAAAEGETIAVVLAKSLDAKKLKQGDPVEARLTDELRLSDGTIIPRGSKVSGHITKAEARGKGDAASQLGISFDRIVPKSGRTTPVKSSIQAVGPPLNLTPAALDNSQQSIPGAPGSSPIGAANPPAGLGPPQQNFPTAPSAGTNPPTSQNGQPSPAQITPQSTGVVGLHDLQLESGSILASGGKDVKLEAGSQILLRVQSQ